MTLPTGRGWLAMYVVELTKLRSQLRVRVALGVCVLGPLLFEVALSVQSGVPADTLFGRWVHESGFAPSLVVLGFSGQWAIPILIAIVAGDSFAGEDYHRTWTLLLTRSRSRGEVFAGKVLAVATFAVVAVSLLAVSSTIAGVLSVGSQPLVGLSGSVLTSGAASLALLLSWLTVLLPTFAVAAIAVLASVVSRNSWVGVMAPVVVVLLLDLISLLSLVDPVRPLLPTTGFEAWHGLVRAAAYTGPLQASALVSAAWITGTLGLASLVLSRRDVVDA